MKCPYQDDLDCPYVDTLAMDKEKLCQDCENFDWDEALADWNEFMIRL